MVSSFTQVSSLQIVMQQHVLFRTYCLAIGVLPLRFFGSQILLSAADHTKPVGTNKTGLTSLIRPKLVRSNQNWSDQTQAGSIRLKEWHQTNWLVNKTPKEPSQFEEFTSASLLVLTHMAFQPLIIISEKLKPVSVSHCLTGPWPDQFCSDQTSCAGLKGLIGPRTV